MYEIKIRTSFSAAHNLKYYKGSCEHLHGHNWVVESVFAYDRLDKIGMAIDFRIAKKTLRAITERLDHSYLNKSKYTRTINPTSENIAKFIYDHIRKKNKSIRSVSVWENENSCATYSEGLTQH